MKKILKQQFLKKMLGKIWKKVLEKKLEINFEKFWKTNVEKKNLEK